MCLEKNTCCVLPSLLCSICSSSLGMAVQCMVRISLFCGPKKQLHGPNWSRFEHS